VRSAVRPSLFLIVFLVTAGTNTWSGERSSIRVEAMVGEAVVVFEDIDCPDDVYRVPTGEAAITYPDECNAVVALSTVSNKVNDVVWAIAAADPDDLGAAAEIKILLAGLTTAEQALVIVVLFNNAQHLGTNDATVIRTVGAIIEVNPAAASVVVMTASVIDPLT
jgi:hypothetical protein